MRLVCGVVVDGLDGGVVEPLLKSLAPAVGELGVKDNCDRAGGPFSRVKSIPIVRMDHTDRMKKGLSCNAGIALNAIRLELGEPFSI